MKGPAGALVADGHVALREGDLAEARRCFEKAAADPTCGEAFEGLARCRYSDVNYPGAIREYEHAYRAFRARADDRSSLRAALAIAYLSAVNGDFAVMDGWVGRARSLLSALEGDSLATAWVELFESLSNPDVGARETTLRECMAVGRRYDDADLTYDAMSLLGQLHVEQGRYDEGLRMLDEALAAARSGDVTGFFVVEGIFCGMFVSCERAQDVARAEQWLRSADVVVQELDLRTVSAFCRAHYGGVLIAAGRWNEAEGELTHAKEIFAAARTPAYADAVVRLAALRVQQGRLEQAEQLLAGHEEHADAALPLATLYLALGRNGEARERIVRSLAAVGASPMAVPLLALLVEVHLADGSLHEADTAARQAADIATPLGNDYLNATVALARGRVFVTADPSRARECLREAIAGFARAATPLELAEARTALASAGVSPEVAIAEARAALVACQALGASRHVDVAAALLRSLGAPVYLGRRGEGGLTRREAEVLDLLGHGLSNPEIADRLYISRKTVGHHVSRILSKLDVRNRAEAAAYAVRRTGQQQR